MTDVLPPPSAPCRRHVWGFRQIREPGVVIDEYYCTRCDRLRDEARSRRGRTSLRAGKDAERAIAKAYNGTRTGHFGGADDVQVGELLIVQSKAGGWFTERYYGELEKLPRAGGHIPMLVVSDRPGAGHKTRRYVVMKMSDHIALLGRDGLDRAEE